MFYYLDGTVAEIGLNLAVLDVGGVGFAVAVTARTLSTLDVGKKAKLYTYCNIKEDAFDIFGFHDVSEKRCFELLLSVSGVGPKAALAILSVCTPEQLALAVVSDDDKALTRASGVGKKLALRVILELKDKVGKQAAALKADGYIIPQSTSGGKTENAAAGLAVLGYSQAEISVALRGIDIDSMTVEEIIREVLKGSLK
ncbi:MAG: Holliday junction branch migration protein RuvA [Oscillospiraceae bacterium]|jgi:Holliday junction DNA helicase RuvA|nr:Holliday junction branch migration protein RuvA [Oscillospiraceae bacterium]